MLTEKKIDEFKNMWRKALGWSYESIENLIGEEVDIRYNGETLDTDPHCVWGMGICNNYTVFKVPSVSKKIVGFLDNYFFPKDDTGAWNADSLTSDIGTIIFNNLLEAAGIKDTVLVTEVSSILEGWHRRDSKPFPKRGLTISAWIKTEKDVRDMDFTFFYSFLQACQFSQG